MVESNGKVGIVKKLLYFVRRMLFSNTVGELIILNMADFNPTYPFSRKLIVPVAEQRINNFRRVLRNGIMFDLNISHEVDHFIYFKYKDTTFDYLHDEIKKARTIIDVGGNIGAFALLFEKLNPTATIHTFEPHPVLYKRLQQHLQINSSKVISHNIGLGERKESVRLYEVDERNPGMNRIFSIEQQNPYCAIHLESLDEYWERCDDPQIDFIKIDVEGFELSVLKGAYSKIKKYHPVLVIELNDNNLRNNNASASELIIWLNEVGYNCIRTVDKKTNISRADNFTNCHFDIVATVER